MGISGINLEMGNLSDSNIIIKDIDILSTSVEFNLEKLLETEPCPYTSTVCECLGIDYYSFTSRSETSEISYLFRKNNTLKLYLPF